MTVFRLLLLVHVMASVIGIGPGFLLPIISKLLRSPGTEATAGLQLLSRVLPFMRNGGILVLLSGAGMVAMTGGAPIRSFWLPTALTLFAVMLALILAVVQRVERQLVKLRGQVNDGAVSPEYQKLVGKLTNASTAVCALLGVILILMVMRPM